MNRDLSGVYYRLLRDDKYENIDITDMTEEEQRSILEDETVTQKYLFSLNKIFIDTLFELQQIIESFKLDGNLNPEEISKEELTKVSLKLADVIKNIGDVLDIQKHYENEEEEDDSN